MAGRSGAGKSALINALRGLSYGDLHAAGRYPSEKMEPFAFIEDDLQDTILWEIPYPRMLNSVLEVYDRAVAFDRLYGYVLYPKHHLSGDPPKISCTNMKFEYKG